MNEQMIEQQDSSEVLTCEVSDEALEAAGGGRALCVLTFHFTSPYHYC
jgi:hypothetical protein